MNELVLVMLLCAGVVVVLAFVTGRETGRSDVLDHGWKRSDEDIRRIEDSRRDRR